MLIVQVTVRSKARQVLAINLRFKRKSVLAGVKGERSEETTAPVNGSQMLMISTSTTLKQSVQIIGQSRDMSREGR